MISNWLKRLRNRNSDGIITVVSGLPRSGTSLMMKMLEAGGIPPFTDNLREKDDDNPKGYYEFERVKALAKGDVDWVPQARGKVVKVISSLLKHLPSDQNYRILFMRRNMQEILASQKKMLQNRGEEDGSVSDDKMACLFQDHLVEIEGWISGQANMSCLFVSYNELVRNPAKCLTRLGEFLDHRVDTAAMQAVVDPGLYRHRADSLPSGKK